MRAYRFDHIHLRSPDPDATARFFETMFDGYPWSPSLERAVKWLGGVASRQLK